MFLKDSHLHYTLAVSGKGKQLLIQFPQQLQILCCIQHIQRKYWQCFKFSHKYVSCQINTFVASRNSAYGIRGSHSVIRNVLQITYRIVLRVRCCTPLLKQDIGFHVR